MSSRFLHTGSDEQVETAHDARHERRGSSVRITVTVANRYVFDAEAVTGRQIKERARVPAAFALYRRKPDRNEPIADDEQIELHNGDLLRAPIHQRLMSGRTRTLLILLGGAVVGAAVVMRHVRGAKGKRVPGGILIEDAALYDAISHRFLLGSLFRRIAGDIAAVAPEGAKVLEVRCGPGRLSILMAREHGLDVTGLDLDPAMIERARANAERSVSDGGLPSFLVDDVASMAFPDGSFDLVVSTLSMQHWEDPSAEVNEIARVLRPGGRALVWDFRSGRIPLHGRLPDSVERLHGSSLRVVRATPWRWPGRLSLTRRVELVRADAAPEPAAT
jgi:SAM-dependent methyltransferase